MSELAFVNVVLYHIGGKKQYVYEKIAYVEDAEYINSNKLILSAEQLSTGQVAAYLCSPDDYDHEQEQLVIQKNDEHVCDCIHRLVQVYKQSL